MLDLKGSASLLKWSPAGDQLLLALAPTALVDDEYMKRKVHVVDVANTGSAGVSPAIVAKFDNPGKLGALAWAPDGKHIAMLSAADLNDPSEGRLVVGDVATGELKDVLPNYEGAVAAIAWQDVDKVMFVGDVGCETTFGKVSIGDLSTKTVIPPGGQILGDLTLARDGKHAAFVASTARHPPEVYSMTHADSAPRRLTVSNPWLEKVQLAKQEVVTYKARDGLELQGILIHPLDERPRMLYPLIMYIHGGPESHERNGWLTNYSRPGQVAAAGGYFTFYPNYRGSTGRGLAFSKLSQGDEAGKEFDDLVDAIEPLAAAFPMDKSKVGITGGSYGGYATAWCCTALTDHFTAGVMFVGISNTISKKGTTDIPNEDYLVHTLARPWDDGGKWQFFLERSPIYHVTKARTPLLIMGGKADTRVHPSQSLELFHFLKTLGQAPVRLVQFPGEGHGNRKAALKLDYNLRMMQWFEHYLKGPGGAPPAYEIDYDIPADETKNEEKK
jgi:dipeptidyl aminopeptidase/acylaminoacyl peptidase